MRPFPLFAAALLLAAPVALRAQYSAPAKPKPAAPAATPAESEQEEKIPGLVLTRANGHYLSIEVEGVRLKVTFYNEKKKKEPADAVRITARWDHPAQTGTQRAVLLPSSPETLMSPPLVRAPHTYNVLLVFIGADNNEIESRTVDLGSIPKG